MVDTIEDESFDGGGSDSTDGTGLSLREAIGLANMVSGADTIVFAAGSGEAFETGGTIRLTLGQIEITEELTIDGSNSPRVLITGDATENDVVDADGITDVAATAAANLSDNSRIFNIGSFASPVNNVGEGYDRVPCWLTNVAVGVFWAEVGETGDA